MIHCKLTRIKNKPLYTFSNPAAKDLLISIHFLICFFLHSQPLKTMVVLRATSDGMPIKLSNRRPILPLADLVGRRERTSPLPRFLIDGVFWANAPNNRLAPLPFGIGSPSPHVWEIFDPPLLHSVDRIWNFLSFSNRSVGMRLVEW